MSTTLKSILLLCGCFILVGGVVLYLYQQNKPDPEPIKIFKVPKLAPKQDISVKTPSGKSSSAEVKSIEDTQVGHEFPPHEHSQDRLKISTPAVPDTSTLEKKDDVLSEEVIQKWVTEAMEELEQLNTRFMEKYPELFEISKMTQEEFLEKYKTPEEQQAFLKYVQSVQPEMFAELRAVFSNIPIEIVDDILLEAKDHFVKMWGQEATDHVMSQLQTELGL